MWPLLPVSSDQLIFGQSWLLICMRLIPFQGGIQVMGSKKKYFSINLDFFKAYHKIIMKILLIELN